MPLYKINCLNSVVFHLSTSASDLHFLGNSLGRYWWQERSSEIWLMALAPIGHLLTVGPLSQFNIRRLITRKTRCKLRHHAKCKPVEWRGILSYTMVISTIHLIKCNICAQRSICLWKSYLFLPYTFLGALVTTIVSIVTLDTFNKCTSRCVTNKTWQMNAMVLLKTINVKSMPSIYCISPTKSSRYSWILPGFWFPLNKPMINGSEANGFTIFHKICQNWAFVLLKNGQAISIDLDVYTIKIGHILQFWRQCLVNSLRNTKVMVESTWHTMNVIIPKCMQKCFGVLRQIRKRWPQTKEKSLKSNMRNLKFICPFC